MEGESGRNELLRGPFALFGVRSSAKLVRDLAKHRRTPMSPPQLVPPTSPGRLSLSHALNAGMDLVAATQCYRVREIRYAFHAPF